MFKYTMSMHCEIEGRDHEFSWEWVGKMQLRAGDAVHIGDLGEVKVANICWYYDAPNEAFAELEDVLCEGPASKWAWLPGELGGCVPPLTLDKTAKK